MRLEGPPAYVLGLDPSITGTGVATAHGSTLTIKVTKGDLRLVQIRDHVAHHLATEDYALVVIEDLPTHAHGAGITGMVQGVIRAACLDHDTPYVTVPPASLKKYATGRGNADKTLMRMEAFKRAGVEFHDDNQCDAWWLRAMGMQAIGHPIVELPQAQVAAMAVVVWPGVAAA